MTTSLVDSPRHSTRAAAARLQPRARRDAAGTFAAPILRGFCDALGLDASRLLAADGVDPAALIDPEGRVPLDVAFRIFDEAPLRSGLAHAGLAASQRTVPGSLGIADLVCRAAPTMEETFVRLQRYYPLIDDRTTIDVTLEGDVVRLVLRDRSEMPAPRAAREYLFGLVVGRWRDLTGVDAPVLQVSFASSLPVDAQPYREVFGSDIRFGRTITEMLLRAEGFRARVVSSDPVLLAYLERQADLALERLPREDRWLHHARRVVMHALAARDASLDAAARSLAMSPRSLQRRLREAGTTYQELADSIRRELGVRWVADAALGVEDIAEKLDFSDATSFHRAFKRWTGETPRVYRRRLRPQ